MLNHPLELFEPSSDKQLTIGDLHGNALKLLHLLIAHQIVEMSKESYRKCVFAYISASGKRDLTAFLDELNTIKVNKDAVGTLRLLGDVLADRGENDYFTLKIFQLLDNAGLKFEIIYSNHDEMFFDCYEHGTLITFNKQRRSFFNMQFWIRSGLIEQQEVDVLLSEHYVPHLRALSLSCDEKSNQLTIYTHAPASFSWIAELAEELGVTFSAESVQYFARSVHRINLAVLEKTRAAELSHLTACEGSALYKIISNRDTDGISRPTQLGELSVCYVHRHDFSGTI